VDWMMPILITRKLKWGNNMQLRITIKSLCTKTFPNSAGELIPSEEVKIVLEGKAKIKGPIDKVRKLLFQTELNANTDGTRRVWIEEV